MAEEHTSSGATSGAIPAPDTQPVTGNAPGGAMPQKPTVTLEEALAQYADLQKKFENAEGELKRHRDFRTKYDKQQAEAEAAKKAAEEAQLSEIERVKKQHADIQAQHNAVLLELQETRIQHAVERAAHDLGFLHPEIAGRLLDRAELEFEDNGAPKNAKQLLEKLLKSMPELARTETPAGQPAIPQSAASTAPTRPGTPALPAMNPGRTAITPPGTLPPGRPVRLADIRRK